MTGAVTIHAEIEGHNPYRLVFKFGTMRLAEKELGKPIGQVFQSGEVSFEALSAVFWAVLQPHHGMTREAADNLVDDAGVDAMAGWIGEGIERYFGVDVPAGAAEDSKPEKAEGGNGRKTRKGKA